MTVPHRGRRFGITVRLGYDDYREVAVRSKRQRWSMNEWVTWLIQREIKRNPRPPIEIVEMEEDDESQRLQR